MRAHLRSLAATLLFERPARGRGLDELAARLAAAGKRLERRLAELEDEPRNRERLAYIIATERWAQRRLRVALGERLELEGSDRYRPDDSLTWNRLRRLFRTTRQATIALAGDLTSRQIDPALRVPHDRFGELTLRGWLSYIHRHAARQARGFHG